MRTYLKFAFLRQLAAVSTLIVGAYFVATGPTAHQNDAPPTQRPRPAQAAPDLTDGARVPDLNGVLSDLGLGGTQEEPDVEPSEDAEDESSVDEQDPEETDAPDEASADDGDQSDAPEDGEDVTEDPGGAEQDDEDAVEDEGDAADDDAIEDEGDAGEPGDEDAGDVEDGGEESGDEEPTEDGGLLPPIG